MKFEFRKRMCESILESCVYGAEKVMLAGEGISVLLGELLIRSMLDLYFNGHVSIIQTEPVLRVYFHGGGKLVVVDYSVESPRGRENVGLYDAFDKIYVMEDRPANMIAPMRDELVPIMKRNSSTTMLVSKDFSDVDERTD